MLINRIFKYLGFFLVAILICGLVFFSYSYNKYRNHEREIKLLIPEFLAGMTKTDSDFGGILVNERDKINFQEFKILGSYIDCPKKEGNTIEISSSEKPLAKIDLMCRFEHSDARIRATLQRLDNYWELVDISVSSNLFNKQERGSSVI